MTRYIRKQASLTKNLEARDDSRRQKRLKVDELLRDNTAFPAVARMTGVRCESN